VHTERSAVAPSTDMPEIDGCKRRSDVSGQPTEHR
jgi:hypothetical protein